MTDQLDKLIAMTRTLGQPERDFVILGEGNSSTRADESSFWVKASGTQMARAERSTFVRVGFKKIIDALERPDLSDADVSAVLRDATLDGERTPSIETFLHALCLQLDDVAFVGHTHPTAAVGLLSSHESREIFEGSLFPDQIVLLGAAYVYIPYADPGLALARSVRSELEQFVYRKGHTPRVILMENHGVIALGSTPTQVVNITEMLVKTCHTLIIARTVGEPRFLTSHQVDRIDTRPDEQRRRGDLK